MVLVRPREEGNVGSVARAMANMGLEQLILVEPAVRLGGIARGFGVGGWQVLDGCSRCANLRQAIAPFRCVVGTSSARERPLSQVRKIEPRQLPSFLGLADDTALVFGPEDNGLGREELELCDAVVRIPCAPQQPTLNLAQAVLVIAYELHLARGGGGAGTPRRERATRAELEPLLDLTAPLLLRLGYDHPPIHAGLIRQLRRLLLRAQLDSREAGVLRRLLNRGLERLSGEPPPDAE